MMMIVFIFLGAVSLVHVHSAKLLPIKCPLYSCAAPPDNCRYVTDSDECTRCNLECDAPVSTCPPPPPCAPPLDNCHYVLDENGCMSCNLECEAPVSTCPPPPPCAAPPEGCNYVSDENGCMTCTLECQQSQCPPVCDIYCPNGNILDDMGCETCNCNPEKTMSWE